MLGCQLFFFGMCRTNTVLNAVSISSPFRDSECLMGLGGPKSLLVAVQHFEDGLKYLFPQACMLIATPPQMCHYMFGYNISQDFW